MIEVKARLYDIEDSVRQIVTERSMILKTLKETVLGLREDLFIPVFAGKVEEVKLLTEQLLKNIKEHQELLREREELLKKLEVLK